MSSHTVDPKQNLKQIFWFLKGKRDLLLKKVENEENRVKESFASEQVSQGSFIHREEANLTKYQNQELERKATMRAEISALENYYSVKSSQLFPLFRNRKLKKLRNEMERKKDEIIKNSQFELQGIESKIQMTSDIIVGYNSGLKKTLENDSKLQNYRTQLSAVQAQYQSIFDQLSNDFEFQQEYQFEELYSKTSSKF